MKPPAHLLREKNDPRAVPPSAAPRDPLLPLRRSFDDDADDWVGTRLGWQPARVVSRPPVVSSAAAAVAPSA